MGKNFVHVRALCGERGSEKVPKGVTYYLMFPNSIHDLDKLNLLMVVRTEARANFCNAPASSKSPLKKAYKTWLRDDDILKTIIIYICKNSIFRLSITFVVCRPSEIAFDRRSASHRVYTDSSVTFCVICVILVSRIFKLSVSNSFLSCHTLRNKLLLAPLDTRTFLTTQKF